MIELVVVLDKLSLEYLGALGTNTRAAAIAILISLISLILRAPSPFFWTPVLRRTAKQ